MGRYKKVEPQPTLEDRKRRVCELAKNSSLVKLMESKVKSQLN